ncbi:hypothetical protein [Pseudoalteromonas xiamenensis]|jgi:hypothetical protein|uniref:Uncharacterized protein n=1 Tax=Pseudoalteromonas xiamenensis TaxID=882626 RepID=A0A975DEL6_9GAMM|nr:hypothetical protein [Pseudoalteromonas xiamenensis]QTH70408.1 hypothetical protein J5O05_10385 [Pseudoalteromonas xiamenensis]
MENVELYTHQRRKYGKLTSKMTVSYRAPILSAEICTRKSTVASTSASG